MAIKRNPLRLDPTRTGMLRRAFEAEIYKRFRRLKGKVLDLVERRDVFGLRESNNRVFNVRFNFKSDAKKIDEFEKWFRNRVEKDVLGTTIEQAEDAWLRRYIAEGYEKGAGRAFTDVRKPALSSQNGNVSDFFQGTRDEFLRQSFAAPEAIDKVKVLVSRTFSDLKGATEAMTTSVRRELADGLVRGENPRVIARRLNDRVDKIGRTRANVIARTEIIRAHGEGQLDAFDKLEVAEVGVMAEWSTAGDDRVCPLCQPLEGTVMTIKEARGILPRHPQCRCTWIPANVGESKKKQHRGATTVAKQRNKSVKAQFPKDSLAEAKSKTLWRGADSRFAKVRPRSVLDGPPPKVPKAGAGKVSKKPSKSLTGGVPKPTPDVGRVPTPRINSLKLKRAIKRLDEMPCVTIKNNLTFEDLIANIDTCLDVDMLKEIPFAKKKLPNIDWKADDIADAEILISELKTQTKTVNKGHIKKFLGQLEQGKEFLAPRVIFFEETGEFFIQNGHHKVLAKKFWGETSMKVRLKTIPSPTGKIATPKFPVAPSKAPIPVTPATEFPSPSNLKKLKDLPGSTRPELMEDITTQKKWVMKSVDAGIDPKHLRSEVLADDLYRELGVNVPKSRIIDTAEGPVKLSEFLEEAESLEAYIKRVSAVKKNEMFKQIGDDFVADALLANHDVAGMTLDNILVVNGKPVRIDNGGALLFRAQGEAKRNFGKVVEELVSMKSTDINSQTARVFKFVTDSQIDEQTEKFLAKRAAVLSKIEEPSLRKIVSERFDFLEERLKSRTTPVTRSLGGDRAKNRFAEPGITDETAERVAKSRGNGTSVSMDRDLIEDGTALVWEEIDETGQAVTRMQLKVTPKGGKKIDAIVGDNTLKSVATPAGSEFLQEDIYWEKILKAAKTVSHHATDGQYNQSVLMFLDDASLEIDALLTNPSTGGEFGNMLLKYSGYIEEIKAAKEAGKVTPKFARFKPKVKSQKPTPVNQAFASRKEAMQFPVSDIKKGRLKRISRVNEVNEAEHVVINLGEGVEARYLPASEAVSDSHGLAFRGNLEIEITGKVSKDTLQKAIQSLENLGIDTAAPTAEFQELLYLHRSIVLNNDHKGAGYLKIWNSDVLTDEQKLKKIKTWAKKKYPEAVFSGPEYNPLGFSETGFGDGYQHWNRWDLTAKKIEEQLTDHVLTHSPGIGTVDLVDKVLESGGQFTSTIQRIRKGVSLGDTGGQSSQADIRSGGASYFFTRIKTRKLAKEIRGIHFKIRNLARQDAISYEGDNYGAIARMGERLSKVSDYASPVVHGRSNETIFKHGLSLLDDVDVFHVKSKLEKDKLLDVFKKHKVDKLNDGRKVEDVITVWGTGT